MGIRFEKLVGSLPANLKPHTIYFIRTGVGFSIYFTDVTGAMAHKLNTDSAEVLESQITVLTNTLNSSIANNDSIVVAINKLQQQIAANKKITPTIYNSSGVIQNPKIFVGTTTATDGVWQIDISAAQFTTIYSVNVTPEAVGTAAGHRRIAGISQNGIAMNRISGYMLKSDSAGLLAAMTLVNGEGNIYVTVYGA